MKLPNGESAVIGDKLSRYCLNPEHHIGKHKARLFETRLGITIENAEVLEQALTRSAVEDDVVQGDRDEYGQRFNTRFSLSTEKAVVVNHPMIFINLRVEIPSSHELFFCTHDKRNGHASVGSLWQQQSAAQRSQSFW
jgi:hypothetical protein